MTDTQVVKKRSDGVDIKLNNSHEDECVDLMKGLYSGKFWLLPMFAQQLVSYLHEDMPISDNPRVAAHHIATRGMFVLQKAYQLSDNAQTLTTTENCDNDANHQNDENSKKPLRQLEFKVNKISYVSLAREILLLIAGCLYGKQQYFAFLILFACICVVHPIYDSISSRTKQYLICVYVCLVAYNIV